MYASRDCDGLTKLWRHEPVAAEGPTGTYYHGTGQRFVIDNTNSTRDERCKYVEATKAARYEVVGYYFQSKVEDGLRRNANRPESERVPDVAILSTAKKLELPTWEEGFDTLKYVRLTEVGFVVEEWDDEI